MAEPKGYLVVPVGFRADGSLHALELNTSDHLKVEVTNTNLVETPHVLLDGAINLDTVAQSVSEGSMIVGIDQGAGVIKWDELPHGATGEVLTILGGANPAWVAPSGGGVIVQVVHVTDVTKKTGTTTVPLDDTIPTNTEGDEYMTLAITPTDAANILQIEAFAHINPNVINFLVGSLFQDAVAAALVTAVETAAAAYYTQLVIQHEMVAGTTSATTFKLRVGGTNAGTLTFNGQAGARQFGGALTSWMRITERTP